jgi:hypothetical protein
MKLRFKQEKKTMRDKVMPTTLGGQFVYGPGTYYREYTETGPKILQYFCEENQEWCDVPLETIEVQSPE